MTSGRFPTGRDTDHEPRFPQVTPLPQVPPQRANEDGGSCVHPRPSENQGAWRPQILQIMVQTSSSAAIRASDPCRHRGRRLRPYDVTCDRWLPDTLLRTGQVRQPSRPLLPL
jgi:hypothetical protein